MCKKSSVSPSFIVFTIILYISTFVLTLLNMIVSILNSLKSDAFNYIELTDYKNPTNYQFLMNLHFYSYSESSDDYGSIGTIKNICYLGTCVNDFENITTYNCSLACLNKIENCFDGENPCIKKECEEYPGSDRNKACHEFNRIKYWRNTQVKKYINNFQVNRYSQIIPKDTNCTSGYKKCGRVSDEQDYLCLKNEYDCPINSIIINSSRELPGEDYRSYKLGDN